MPQDWRDALLVPIPKKGDLSRCDNWRGIALLEVVGKLAARIMQNRLQGIAEAELPEPNAGFLGTVVVRTPSSLSVNLSRSRTNIDRSSSAYLWISAKRTTLSLAKLFGRHCCGWVCRPRLWPSSNYSIHVSLQSRCRWLHGSGICQKWAAPRVRDGTCTV